MIPLAPLLGPAQSNGDFSCPLPFSFPSFSLSSLLLSNIRHKKSPLAQSGRKLKLGEFQTPPLLLCLILHLINFIFDLECSSSVLILRYATMQARQEYRAGMKLSQLNKSSNRQKENRPPRIAVPSGRNGLLNEIKTGYCPTEKIEYRCQILGGERNCTNPLIHL